MANFQVSGVSREMGEELSFMIAARDETSAAKLAGERGMMVETVVNAATIARAVPQPAVQEAAEEVPFTYTPAPISYARAGAATPQYKAIRLYS